MNVKRPVQVLALCVMFVLAACGDQATNTPAATTAPAAAATTAPAMSATTAPASGATTAPAMNATTAPAAGSTTAPAATGGADIKIGVIGPLTGASAPFGEAITRGIEIAAEEINAAGGINGRKIVLISRDDKATADTGKTVALDLIQNEKVDALLGVANTAVGTVVVPEVQKAKIPFIDTVSTGSKFIDSALPGQQNYAFRVSLRDDIQTRFALDYALSKYKKVAIMSDTTTYGQSGRDDLLAYAKTKGITFVEDQTYKIGDQDMGAQLQKISAAGADVIVNWGLGPEAAQIVKSRQKLGLTIPMVGSWGLSRSDYVDLAGQLAEGTYFPQSFIVDQASAANPKAKTFLDKYRSKYNVTKIGFPSGLAQSYDSMQLLAIAMKAAGPNFTKDQLRDAIQNIDSYDGLVKSYKQPFLGKNGTSAKANEAFVTEDFKMAIVKGGVFVAVDAK